MDAELAAIDFALQEELELKLNVLNKELKKKQLHFEGILEKEEYKLKKKRKDTKRKKDKYKAYIKKARIQAYRKAFLKEKRMTLKELGDVAKNVNVRITSFEELLIPFFKRWKITNINQIIKIESKPARITLKTGEVIPIAPLKYYHLHELIDWWKDVHFGHEQLDPLTTLQIDAVYDKDLKEFLSKADTELRAFEEIALEKINSTKKEYGDITLNIKFGNDREVKKIKEKYKKRKEILAKLFARREKEELEIHDRYDVKYKEVLKKANEKAQQLNDFILSLFQKGSANQSVVENYKKKIKKYQLGLQRLKEEKIRLDELEKRYKIQEKRKAHIDDLTLMNHLRELLPFDI